MDGWKRGGKAGGLSRPAPPRVPPRPPRCSFALDVVRILRRGPRHTARHRLRETHRVVPRRLRPREPAGPGAPPSRRSRRRHAEPRSAVEGAFCALPPPPGPLRGAQPSQCRCGEGGGAATERGALPAAAAGKGRGSQAPRSGPQALPRGAGRSGGFCRPADAEPRPDLGEQVGQGAGEGGAKGASAGPPPPSGCHPWPGPPRALVKSSTKAAPLLHGRYPSGGDEQTRQGSEREGLGEGALLLRGAGGPGDGVGLAGLKTGPTPPRQAGGPGWGI